MPRIAWIAITLLTIAVFVLLVLLFVIPGPKPGGQTTPPPSPIPAPQPFTSENVNITVPLPEALVPKTFTVIGEARGTWYFEASFPVQVRDPDNSLVGQGIAQAGADWMTENFVPFSAKISVPNYTGPATLVLLKDNPSGLPENDNAVFFPITVQ